jgi:hypothetical protein
MGSAAMSPGSLGSVPKFSLKKPALSFSLDSLSALMAMVRVPATEPLYCEPGEPDRGGGRANVVVFWASVIGLRRFINERK